MSRRNVWVRPSTEISEPARTLIHATAALKPANDLPKSVRSTLAWRRPGYSATDNSRSTTARNTEEHPARQVYSYARRERAAAPCGRPSAAVLTGAGTMQPDAYRHPPAPFKRLQTYGMARSCTAAVLAAAGAAAGQERAAHSGTNSGAGRLVHVGPTIPVHVGQATTRGGKTAGLLSGNEPARVAQRPVAAQAGGLPTDTTRLRTQPLPQHLRSPGGAARPKCSRVWLRPQIAADSLPAQACYGISTGSRAAAPVQLRRSAVMPRMPAAVMRKPKTWTRIAGLATAEAVQQGGISFVKGGRSPGRPRRREAGAALHAAKSPAFMPRSKAGFLVYRKLPARNALHLVDSPVRRSLSWQNPSAGSALYGLSVPVAKAAAAASSNAACAAATSTTATPRSRSPTRFFTASRRLSSCGMGSFLPRLSSGGVVKARSKRLEVLGKATVSGGSRSTSTPGTASKVAWRFNRVVGLSKSTSKTLFRSSAAACGARATRLTRQLPRRQKYGTQPIIFCPSYCRSGICKKRSEGRCKYCHDSSKVAVCPAWLGGHCDEKPCPLQHAHVPELMPTCTFFLQGLCSRADCPWLHVNLEPAAPVCKDFMRGYCSAGASCRAKHLTQRMLRDSRPKRTLLNSAQAQVPNKPPAKRARYFPAAEWLAPPAIERPEELISGAIAVADINCDGEGVLRARHGLSGRHSMLEALSPWPEFVAIPDGSDSD